MIKYRLFIIGLLLLRFIPGSSQESAKQAAQKKAFENMVDAHLSYSIPVVNVNFVKDNLEKLVILDTRELHEYEISHIPKARHIGFDKFDIKSLPTDITKDKQIVVYCSIGYRSEKIGEKLKDAGYTKVYNLYGSIFDWANNGLPLIDKNNKATQQIHGYNKKWSSWITNPKLKVRVD